MDAQGTGAARPVHPRGDLSTYAPTMETRRRRHRAFSIAVVAAVAMLAIVGCGDDDDTDAGAPDATDAPTGVVDGSVIVIDDVAFTNPELTVPAGTTVTFDNQDGQAHTATSEDGSFDTDTIAAGSKVDITFDEAGTFPFFCAFHPFMKGTVTVE